MLVYTTGWTSIAERRTHLSHIVKAGGKHGIHYKLTLTSAGFAIESEHITWWHIWTSYNVRTIKLVCQGWLYVSLGSFFTDWGTHHRAGAIGSSPSLLALMAVSIITTPTCYLTHDASDMNAIFPPIC